MSKMCAYTTCKTIYPKKSVLLVHRPNKGTFMPSEFLKLTEKMEFKHEDTKIHIKMLSTILEKFVQSQSY